MKTEVRGRKSEVGKKRKKEPAIVRDLPAGKRRLWRSLHKAFLRELQQQDGLYSPEIGNKRLTKSTYYGTVAHNLALLAVWALDEEDGVARKGAKPQRGR